MTNPTPPAVRIDPDGTVTVLADAEYETLSDAIGGWFDIAPTDGRVVIWLDDFGKAKGLASNPLATALWACVDSYGCIPAGDHLVGPCVITGPGDSDGNTTPVPAWVLPTLAELTHRVATVG